jgi:hypothetical protein
LPYLLIIALKPPVQLEFSHHIPTNQLVCHQLPHNRLLVLYQPHLVASLLFGNHLGFF